ncbi:MAG: CvpA family protein [Melioribacteraceae bacterium]|nr:CvpA family protein [Melioribacteraceae bacterium]MCF8352944.1 CvpA family protein [Melioribacteraceae bacterium]MCF8395880.1 CvpA family protein [Melioribacteraceae bacterium]MCF8417461.1 CvpA family protein [Melioribacteraceae bacterium]
MNYLDYIILIILSVGFVLGYKDGLVRKVIGLIGLAAAIILAFYLSETAGRFLKPIFNNEEYLSEIVASILVFLLIVLAFSIIKRLVHPSDKVNKFINQFLGGLTGTIQMTIFISAFLLFLNIFSIPSEEDQNNSLFYKPVYSIIPVSIDLIMGGTAPAQELIKGYIENKDYPRDSIDIDSVLTN